jgi:toxin YoeB
MKLVFTEFGWDDYLWFQERDRRLLKRINILIKDAMRTPFEGIGKPEPLKGELAGRWSRRISEEHRLIYAIEDEEFVVYNCRYHYGK